MVGAARLVLLSLNLGCIAAAAAFPRGLATMRPRATCHTPSSLNRGTRSATRSYAVRDGSAQSVRRRSALRGVFVGVPLAAAAVSTGKAARSDEVSFSTIEEGLEGSPLVKQGDWVLVDYVGKLKSTGQIFESTRGGLPFLNGGMAEYQPRLFQVNANNPQPGIVQGIYDALKGMKVGESRVVTVPPSLGYGTQTTAGMFAIIPANTELEYEIKVLRLGSDLQKMMRTTARCGQGGQAAQNSGCRDIVPMITD